MENDDDVITGPLGRIADALNVPIEEFFAGGPQSEAIAGADECLRLWMQIGTAEGRRHALESLRKIIEEGK